MSCVPAPGPGLHQGMGASFCLSWSLPGRKWLVPAQEEGAGLPGSWACLQRGVCLCTITEYHGPACPSPSQPAFRFIRGAGHSRPSVATLWAVREGLD